MDVDMITRKSEWQKLYIIAAHHQFSCYINLRCIYDNDNEKKIIK